MLGLDQPRRRELLVLLPSATRSKIERLLSYNPHTAGGLMSADFLAVAADATAAEITSAVATSELGPADLLAVYVHDTDQRLLGAIPLASLIRTSPQRRAGQLADHTRTTNAHADIPQLARLMADYDLLSVPVVDDHDRLLGVIALDDLIEHLLPDGPQ
jgi:Mg/Co/Ni transporter MgtE